jgi:hypothetical protein
VGCEGCRKEISSERIATPVIVDCFRGAPGRVDCFGGAAGQVDSLGEAAGNTLPSFSSEISTYARDTAQEECGTDLSVVIMWVG